MSEQDEIIEKLNELATSEALNSKDVEYIKEEVKDVKVSLNNLAQRVEEFYVNQDQFWPVKTMVYGLAGGILLTVLVAMMTLIIISHTGVVHGNESTVAPSVLPSE